MCPIKYSTDDGFDGNGFKHLLMTLSESSRKSEHSIIRKGYYKYGEFKYARIVYSRYEYYRGKLDQRNHHNIEITLITMTVPILGVIMERNYFASQGLVATFLIKANIPISSLSDFM